jgi:hypothetical protein
MYLKNRIFLRLNHMEKEDPNEILIREGGGFIFFFNELIPSPF